MKNPYISMLSDMSTYSVWLNQQCLMALVIVLPSLSQVCGFVLLYFKYTPMT